MILNILLAYCTLEVAFTKSTLRALIAIVAIFTLASIYTIFNKELFVGFSYALVYIGAIVIVFIIVVLLVDHYQVNVRTNIPSNIAPKILISGIIMSSLFTTNTLVLGLLFPSKENYFDEGGVSAIIGSIGLGDASGTILGLGLVLLLAIVAPLLNE